MGQRSVADYDVLPTSSVAKERSTAQGRVITADRGVIKRLKTNGGVLLAGGVAKERSRTVGRVLDAVSIVGPSCCVKSALSPVAVLASPVVLK